MYAEAFEQVGRLDRLEGFASHFGADFYGLPRNTDTVTLIKQDFKVPNSYPYMDDQALVPLHAGETLSWSIA